MNVVFHSALLVFSALLTTDTQPIESEIGDSYEMCANFSLDSQETESDCEAFVAAKCASVAKSPMREARLETMCIGVKRTGPCCEGTCANDFTFQLICRDAAILGHGKRSDGREKVPANAVDVDQLKDEACPILAKAKPPVPKSKCRDTPVKLTDKGSGYVDRSHGFPRIVLPLPAVGATRVQWQRRFTASLYHEFREMFWRNNEDCAECQKRRYQTSHLHALLDELENATLFGLDEDRDYYNEVEGRIDRRPGGTEIRRKIDEIVRNWKRENLF